MDSKKVKFMARIRPFFIKQKTFLIKKYFYRVKRITNYLFSIIICFYIPKIGKKKYFL